MAPRVTVDQWREAIEEFIALGLTTVDCDSLILAALPLGRRHSIAFYDAPYLALAQELGIPLIAADNRFYERIRSLPLALWLGTYGRREAAGGWDASSEHEGPRVFA